MQVTRRYWTAVTLAVFLATAALVLAEPRLLLGMAGIGAWLFIEQFLFVRMVRRVHDQLAVSQVVTRERVLADEDVSVTLEATLADVPVTFPISLEVEATVPVGATTTDPTERRIRIEDDNSAATTFTVGIPVAGQFEFTSPTVTVTDQRGLFRSTFPATSAPTPEVTVVPKRPRSLHIGRGGDQVTSAFGDHKTGEFGLGLDPGEIREYLPGDSVRQIDWKATARSTSPHVREFDEETDRRTVLFVDQRGSMATGLDGQIKLDYARQVALAFADHTQDEREPIGLYAVGNHGTTTRHPPAAAPATYTRVQTALHDLTPTENTPSTADQSTTTVADPRTARQVANQLATTDTVFATCLRPYFASSQTYVQRIASQPLYTTVRTQLTTDEGAVTAVVITDDQNRAEVREVAKLAREHQGHVLIFLTPTVLFERDGLTDIDRAYDRYADFETFRRDLARLDRVSAFEVAPGDRLDALLASQSKTQRVPK